MKSKILAFIACLIVVFSLSIPCFADGWQWWTYNEITNPTRITLSSAQFQGIYSELTQDALIDMVNIATKCNAFGGYLPVYITMTISDASGTESDNGLSVWCIAPTDLQSAEPLTDVIINTSINPDNNVLSCIAYGSANSYRLFEYGITSNGSFLPTGNTKNLLAIFPYVNGGTAAQRLKLVGQWSGNSDIGITRFNDDVSSFAQYYTAYYAGQYNGKKWSQATTMLSHWQQAGQIIEEGDTIVSYDLNIPALITSIPAAAQSLINNSFGFEVFGINVAGLLSVLLVVIIVGFVIKWLIRR